MGVDTWSEVKDMLTPMAPLLEQQKSGDIGPFAFTRFGSSFNYWYEQNGVTIGTVVTYLSDECHFNPERLANLLVITLGARRELDSFTIQLGRGKQKVYPQFQYTWSARDSKLRSLIIYPASSATVVYENLNVEHPYTCRYGTHLPQARIAMEDYPNSIEELQKVKEVRGTKIPWGINYEAVARSILAKSSLVQFAEELQKEG